MNGFRTAVYREPLTCHATGIRYVRAIVTPFLNANEYDGNVLVEPLLLPQHRKYVETIKTSRAKTILIALRIRTRHLRLERSGRARLQPADVQAVTSRHPVMLRLLQRVRGALRSSSRTSIHLIRSVGSGVCYPLSVSYASPWHA